MVKRVLKRHTLLSIERYTIRCDSVGGHVHVYGKIGRWMDSLKGACLWCGKACISIGRWFEGAYFSKEDILSWE